MGDHIRMREHGRKALVASLAVLLVALGAGCASAPSQTAAAASQSSGSAVAASQVSTPAVIRSLDLEVGEVGAVLLLTADRSPVWTTYRDSEGHLVVELPNSMLDGGVTDLMTEAGLLAAVDVETFTDSERPLTRLVLRTRGESEHALTTEGGQLRIQLLPLGYDAPAQPTQVATYEPLAAEPRPNTPSVEPEVAVEVVELATADAQPRPPQMVYFGTPEAPLSGPEPEGVPASRLRRIEVYQDGDETVVEILGDGEFAYSTFRLESPERFVVDLDGVVNTSNRSTFAVETEVLDQVRVGQFRLRPDPVSRVVFDLSDFHPPRMQALANGLRVSFGSLPLAAVEVAEVAQAPEPVVARVAEVEEMPAPEPPPIEEVVVPPPVDAPPAVVVERLPAEEAIETLSMPTESAPSQMEPEVEAVEVAAAAATPPAAPPVTPSVTPPEAVVTGAAMADSEPSIEPAMVASAVEQVPIDSVPAYQPASLANAGVEMGQEVPIHDVARFEAQQVEVRDGRQTSEPDLTQFDELIVSRQRRTYTGEPISLTLRNGDLVETLRTFARISGLNFVIQPGVTGSVTVELNEVPWDQAMEQILKINNLGMEIDGTIVRIAPMTQLRAEAQEQAQLVRARAATVPLRTVMRSISYGDAAAISALLRNRTGSLLSNRGTVQVDQRTNTLIIRELPSNVDTVLAVIDNLDTPEPQVTIEARIIEATKQFGRSLGIRWGFNGIADAAHGNTTGLEFPNNIDSTGGVALLTGGANGFLDLTLGNILNTFSLDARIQAAEDEGLANVISAPRITTLNNERASIQSGLQIPIQTTSNNTVAVQFINATLQLSVTPHVTAEGTVLLDIDIAKREPQLAFAVVGATNAPIATKEAQTKVIVRDGGTVVIGGIYEVTSNQNQGRVPGLANIPILGHLFKNRSRDDTNDELMIFITPRIVQM